MSEFLLDAVVNGGIEWNCSWVTGEDPGPFSRRILGVTIIGTDIVMNTSGCSPFESFVIRILSCGLFLDSLQMKLLSLASQRPRARMMTMVPALIPESLQRVPIMM